MNKMARLWSQEKKQKDNKINSVSRSYNFGKAKPSGLTPNAAMSNIVRNMQLL